MRIKVVALVLAIMAVSLATLAGCDKPTPPPTVPDGGFKPLGFAGGPDPITTLQDAVVTNTNGSPLYLHAAQMASIQIQGITTATVNFEATIDGTNWKAVALANLGNTSRTRATTATADGIFLLEPAGGLSQFRARISSWSAGTITVKARTY